MAENTRIQLADQYYAEIEVNGKPLPLGASSLEAYITQSVVCKLPTLKLIIRNEPSGSFQGFFEAGDSAQIVMKIGRESNGRFNTRTITSTFRQWGSPKYTPASGGYSVEVLGILDALPYLNQRVPKSYNLNTCDIVREIAGTMGLRTANWRGDQSIDSSNDRQLWRASARNYPDFVHYLADCAWNGDDSCFMTGVDEEKTLYYKNIAKIVKQQPKTKFAQSITADPEGAQLIPILGYKFISQAGAMNNWIGYSYSSGYQGVDGSYKESIQTPVVKGTNFFDINKSQAGSIGQGRGRYHYRPIGAGNTYENIEKARYQNQRIRATFSTQVHVMTEFITNEDLFSCVGFECYDPTTRQLNSLYKGNYIVMAKTRCIVGSRYYEKFKLESQGRSEDKFGNLF